MVVLASHYLSLSLHYVQLYPAVPCLGTAVQQDNQRIYIIFLY